MRTRSQIIKILYDQLSDAKWTKLRDSTIGSELIALATDVVLNYEISHRDTTVLVTPKTREEIRTELKTNVQNAGGIVDETNEVFKALMTWGVECIYQTQYAVSKDYLDQNFRTATCYDAIIDLAAKKFIPVSQFKPSTIMVQLPSGNETFAPYTIAISAGSATYYNINVCSSGDQVNLYQGTPYVYLHSEDTSGFPEATSYESDFTILNPTTTDLYFTRYVTLPSSTLPDSVRVFTEDSELKRWYYGYDTSATDNYKIYFKEDGTLGVYLSDNTSWRQSFASDSFNWCIRFFNLTSVDIDLGSINLPEGYVLLSYNDANPEDLEFARLNFYKASFEAQYTDISYDTMLRKTCLAYPGVQDCAIYTQGVYHYIYIKPTVIGKNIIYTELEDYLTEHKTLAHQFRTYCASAIDVSIIIDSSSVSSYQKARIEEYLKDKYSYDSIAYADELIATTIENDIATKFSIIVDVEFRFKVRINNSTFTLGNTFDNGTVGIYNNGVQEGWDDAACNLYYYTDIVNTAAGYFNYKPYLTLCSCTSDRLMIKDSASTEHVDTYDFRINARTEGGSVFTTLYKHTLFLGANCVFGITEDLGTAYVFPLNESYFKNPGNQTLDFATHAYSINITAAQLIKGCLDQDVVSCIVWDDKHSLLHYARNFSAGSEVTIWTSPISGNTIGTRVRERPVYTSSKFTCISFYNDDIYMSLDDGTVTVLSGYSNASWSQSSSAFCNSYIVLDSSGDRLVDYSTTYWKYANVTNNSNEQLSASNFFFYVSNTGMTQVIALNPKVTVSKPDISSLTDQNITWYGNEIQDQWDYLTDIEKHQLCSTWNVYNASKLKVTAQGLELINLRKIQEVPSYFGCYIANRYSSSYEPQTTIIEGGTYKLKYTYFYSWGPLFTGGMNGSVSSWGQKFKFPNNRHYIINKAWVYDTIYDVCTTPQSMYIDKCLIEPEDFLSGNIPKYEYVISRYLYDTKQVGSYSGATVTLTDGSPLLKNFVAESSTVKPTSDRFIKLDDDNAIIWVS